MNVTGKKNDRPGPRITESVWIRMCQNYGAKELDVNQQHRFSVTENSSVNAAGYIASPEKVFTLDRSMELAQQFGADPRFCDKHNYFDEEGLYRFPDESAVYRIPLENLKPNKQRNVRGLFSFLFPCVLPDAPKGVCLERFLDLHLSPEERKDQAKVAEQTARFSNLHVADVGRDPSSNHRAFFEWGVAEYANLCQRVQNANQQEQRAEFRNFQQRGIAYFRNLWSVSTDLPEALKAIVRWSANYLQSSPSKNFYKPFPSPYANLGPLGWLVVSIFNDLEKYWKCDYLHSRVVSVLFRCLQVYSFTPDHVHSLLFGAPSTGKSWILLFLSAVLVPGSFEKMAAQTAKADTGGATDENETNFMHSFMIFLMEELQPSMYGSDQNKGGSAASAQASSTSDQAALYKNRLTALEMLMRRFTKIDEVWKTVSNRIETNNVFVTCSNATAHCILDEPMKSRHEVDVVHRQRREDKDRTDRTAEPDTQLPPINAAMTLTIERLRVLQTLTSMVFMLINARVLEPVNMRAANLLVKLVIQRSVDYGCNKVDDRLAGHVRSIIKSVTVQKAVYTVFFSALAPERVKKGPFDFRDLLLVAPYLVAGPDEVVYALTSVRAAFEDEAQRIVKETILTHILPVAEDEDTPASRAHLNMPDKNHPQDRDEDFYFYKMLFGDTEQKSSNAAARAAAEQSKQRKQGMNPRQEDIRVVPPPAAASSAGDSNDAAQPPVASRTYGSAQRKTPQERLHVFAREVFTKMDKSVEVTLAEVVAVLRQMTEIQVKTNKGPAAAIDFTIKRDAVTFAAVYIDNLSNTNGCGLTRCISDVFQQCFVKCNNPITANSDQLPNVVKRLNYTFNDEVEQPFLKVTMSNYVPRSELDREIDLFRAQGWVISNQEVYACFDDTPTTLIDQDPFEIAAIETYRMNADLFYKDAEGYLVDVKDILTQLPSNDPLVYLRQQAEVCGYCVNDDKYLYPNALEYRTPEEYKKHLERWEGANEVKTYWSRLVLRDRVQSMDVDGDEYNQPAPAAVQKRPLEIYPGAASSSSAPPSKRARIVDADEEDTRYGPASNSDDENSGSERLNGLLYRETSTVSLMDLEYDAEAIERYR